MLLSGGVDSTVCAALMNRALGVDRVIAIHIDNGFMRKNESDQVRDSLAQLGLDVKGEDQIKNLK
jgi:GMP synthase (glutamine-hydrolysing)